MAAKAADQCLPPPLRVLTRRSKEWEESAKRLLVGTRPHKSARALDAPMISAMTRISRSTRKRRLPRCPFSHHITYSIRAAALKLLSGTLLDTVIPLVRRQGGHSRALAGNSPCPAPIRMKDF